MIPADWHDFEVVIPARLASTRLPNKPLADIGGLPMIVRVAQRAQACGARRVVVATDVSDVAAVVRAHGFRALMTDAAHPTGTDRLAEAADLLELPDSAIVVNVQGDEPLIDPALIRAVAWLLAQRPDCALATAAHPLAEVADYFSPHVVKVVCDARSTALYFSRAPIPWGRDLIPNTPDGDTQALAEWLQTASVLRHIGLYAYRAEFLRAFRQLPQAPIETVECLEQLRALWHGHAIAVHRTPHAPAAGVDTPADLERVRALITRSNAD